ncbi:hypothetical protein [Bradyrhizobium japonicum]|uniref:hypothetical protein n=1 Tax=Bradyrhizobium japonicum TaxID=375 RepID=UPI003395D411
MLATIVSLLEKTLIRVGNAEYAEKNKSYGLTTPQARRDRARGPAVRVHGQVGEEVEAAGGGQADSLDRQALRGHSGT